MECLYANLFSLCMYVSSRNLICFETNTISFEHEVSEIAFHTISDVSIKKFLC